MAVNSSKKQRVFKSGLRESFANRDLRNPKIQHSFMREPFADRLLRIAKIQRDKML